MSPGTHLAVALTCTRHQEPLAVVDGLPVGDAELRPTELRALAAALLRIADDAESRLLHRRGKPTPTERRVYALKPPRALPGLWCEAGGLDRLVRLDLAAVTPGMVVVARQGEDWQRRPELRFQVWPHDLVAVASR